MGLTSISAVNGDASSHSGRDPPFQLTHLPVVSAYSAVLADEGVSTAILLFLSPFVFNSHCHVCLTARGDGECVR